VLAFLGAGGCCGRSARPSLPSTRSICSPTCEYCCSRSPCRLPPASCSGSRPAIQASRPDLVVELKEKKLRWPTGSKPALQPAQSAGVVAGGAVARRVWWAPDCFLRSLQNAQRINPGFDAEHLAVLSFDLGAQGYTEERGRQFQQRVLERVTSVPGRSGPRRSRASCRCSPAALRAPCFSKGRIRRIAAPAASCRSASSGRSTSRRQEFLSCAGEP